MTRSKILGVGKYLPKKILTNEELCSRLGVSKEWIITRCGIKERRIADIHSESTSSMATEAALSAIENAGISKNDIEMIVFATLSPDYTFPGPSVLTQRQLGLAGTATLDIRAQCAGFIHALSVADLYVSAERHKYVLVIGAEAQTRVIDYSPDGKDVAILFGDGAGAFVVGKSEDGESGILSTHLGSDGENAEELALISPGFKCIEPEDSRIIEKKADYSRLITEADVQKRHVFPFMNGKKIFLKAVAKFPEVIHEALEYNDLSASDLDFIVPHQANKRITQAVGKKMKFPSERVFCNIEKYGNTTAASIPIAFCEALEEGLVESGDLVCLAAFGAGLSWGSALLRW